MLNYRFAPSPAFEYTLMTRFFDDIPATLLCLLLFSGLCGSAWANNALEVWRNEAAAVVRALTESSADHSDRALELAKKNGDRIGQAGAYLSISLNSVYRSRIDTLVDVAPRALKVLEGVDRPDLLGEAMLRLAMMYRRMGQIDESVTLCMQAMEIARVGTHLKLHATQKHLEERNAQLQHCQQYPERRVAELNAGNQLLRIEISEHEQAEQQMPMMNFALNRMREAAYLIDRHLRFIYVNNETCWA